MKAFDNLINKEDIKTLEKKFSKYLPYTNDVVSIQELNFNFISDTLTIVVCWGHDAFTTPFGIEVKEEWHVKNLIIALDDVRLCFIVGAFSQLVVDTEESDCED